MMRTWQMQEAENHFDQLIDAANAHGPQIVARRGVEVAVVLAYEDYKRMRKSELPLGQFFLQSPLVGADDLDLERDRSFPREGTPNDR